jgi:hypothetical protein
MRKLILILCVSLICIGIFSESARAFTDNSVAGAYNNAGQSCQMIRETIERDDKDGAWITEYIITCIKAVIMGDDKYGITGAFEIFLNAFYPALEPIIQAAVTLAVVLLGAALLTGLIEKPARDVFVFLLKLAMVVYLVQTSTVQWVYDSSIETMDALTDSVFTFGKGGEVEGRCTPHDEDILWDRVDCMLDVIIGIKQEGSGAQNKVSPDKSGIKRGMMHFFYANMTSGGMGAMIGLLGLYTLFSFVFAVIKSLHTYLAAVLALSFILILMPMFVPMLMFKATRNYFDKWYRISISFILQPVLLFGFLSLMMVAFDMILVSGNNSVTRMIIGDEADTTVLSEALERAGVFEEKKFNQQGIIVAQAGKVTDGLTGTGTGVIEGLKTTQQGASVRDAGAVNNMVLTYRPMEGLDYNKLAARMKDTKDGAEAKERMTYAVILLAMTSFIFLSMLNYIPVMATDLAGGVFEVPNLHEMVGQNFLGANQAESMAHKLSKQVTGGIKRNEAFKKFAGTVGVRS